MSKNSSGRRDRLLRQTRHDVYKPTEKLSDPTLCIECGVLFSEGRWMWKGTEDKVSETVCPACRRISDRNPAGTVSIQGDFFEQRIDEVENLITNTERAETLQRPMERLIQVVHDADGTVVTTTGVHIARRIGDAITRAYGGDYTLEYLDDEKRVRISVVRQ